MLILGIFVGILACVAVEALYIFIYCKKHKLHLKDFTPNDDVLKKLKK